MNTMRKIFLLFFITICAIVHPAGIGPESAFTQAAKTNTNVEGWNRKVSEGIAPVNVKWYANGDGLTDDTVAIQSALTAGSNTTVTFPKGTYRITNELSISSGTILEGQGGATIIQYTAGKRVLVGTGVSNIKISGLTLEGPGPTNVFALDGTGAISIDNYSDHGANILIEKNTVRGFSCGIAVLQATNVWVINNTVENFGRTAICASLCDSFSIDYNNISGSVIQGAENSYGIQASGGEIAGKVQQAGSISFNRISGVPSWDGIMTHDCSGLRIIGNDIRDVRMGIDVTASDVNARLRDIQISDNMILLTTTNTWGAAAGAHCGMYIQGSSTYPLTNIAVRGNIVKGANSMTTVFTPSGTLNSAISLIYASQAVISDNLIVGIGTNLPSFCGIAAAVVGNNVTIAHNVIEGSPGTFIRLDASTSTNLVVAGNTMTTTNLALLGLWIKDGTYDGVIYGNVGNMTTPYVTSGATIVNRFGAGSSMQRLNVGQYSSSTNGVSSFLSINAGERVARFVNSADGASTNSTIQSVSANLGGSAADFGSWYGDGGSWILRGFNNVSRDEDDDVNENSAVRVFALQDNGTLFLKGPLYVTNAVTSLAGITATNFVLSAPYNWIDSMVPAAGLRNGATAPAFAALTATNAQYVLKFSTGDDAHGSIQLNHGYVEGTPIHMHVHYVADADAATPANTNVVWGLDYSWASINGLLSAHTTLLVTNGVVGKGIHRLAEWEPITNNAAGISSIILFRIYRVAAGNTYTDGEPGLLGIDAHYQVSGIGSSLETSK